MNVTPSYLAADNIPFITLYDNGDYLIYDEEFNLTKRFGWPVQRVQYTTTQFIAVPNFKLEGNYEEGPLCDGTIFTIDSAKEWIGYWRKIENHGDETWFINEYYREGEYGENIISHYYCLKPNGMLYSCGFSYGNIIGYTDTWVKDGQEQKSDYYSYPCDLYIEDPEKGFDGTLEVTQTLFNNDDSYEYIMPVFTKGKKEEIYNDREFNQPSNKYVTEGDILSGYMIMTDEGRVLQTISATGNEFGLRVYIIGKYTYIELGDKFYRINKGSSSLTAVNLPAGVKVSPSVVQRSTPINVTAGDSNAERTIKVISTSGMVMTSTVLPSGSNSTTIDTSRFPAGMYVVVVNDGKKNVENCKIIVR